MPCSQPSRMNTFSSSWLMPSTLLGTLQMRGLAAGIAGRAEEEAPFIWGGERENPKAKARTRKACTTGDAPSYHSQRHSKFYNAIKTKSCQSRGLCLPARLNCGRSSSVRYFMGGVVCFKHMLLERRLNMTGNNMPEW